MKSLPRRTSWSLILLLLTWLLLSANKVHAALEPTGFTQDLNQLALQGNELVASMTATKLTPFTLSMQTETLAAEMDSYLAGVLRVYDTTLDTSGSMSLDDEMLGALENLSLIASSLAQQLLRLAGEMVNLGALTASSSLDASLTSMLRLSDDIGVMADRIGEMADRILVMADNIGIMADRILQTQVIQSGNLALVIDAMLLSQQNLVTLASQYQL